MIGLADWIGISGLMIAATGLIGAYVRSHRIYVEAVYAKKDDVARLDERMRAIETQMARAVELLEEIRDRPRAR